MVAGPDRDLPDLIGRPDRVGRGFSSGPIHLYPVLAGGLFLLLALPRHRDKPDGGDILFYDLLSPFIYQNQFLPVRANRNHHPAAIGQLVNQRLRDFFRGAGDNYGIERGVLRPAPVPIADLYEDIFIRGI